MQLIFYSFQSIRKRAFHSSSETLEVSCPSNFLLPIGPRVWARSCIVSGHGCAVGLPACCWKSWCEARGSPPARLAANDTPMVEAGFSWGPLSSAWESQRWFPHMPCSEGCRPPLLCGDSVPSNHQLGSSASGREVSQEIIHHNRTRTQAEFEHLFPMERSSESMALFALQTSSQQSRRKKKSH